MSFKIVITETRTVQKLCGHDWAVVGEKTVKGEKENVFGYTPEIQKRVPESREVLVQNVESLDLNAVIKAINKI